MPSLIYIPARSGSKRVRNKNFRPFFEATSLLDITLNQALMISDKVGSSIYLSTDHEIAGNLIKKKFDKIRLIKRHPDLSSDDATILEALKKDLEFIGDESTLVLILMPTAPFRCTHKLASIMNNYRVSNDERHTVVSVAKSKIPKHLILTKFDDRYEFDARPESVKDTLKTRYNRDYFCCDNFIIDTLANFRRQHFLFSQKPCAVEVTEIESVSIDTELDFKIAQLLYPDWKKKNDKG